MKLFSFGNRQNMRRLLAIAYQQGFETAFPPQFTEKHLSKRFKKHRAARNAFRRGYVRGEEVQRLHPVKMPGVVIIYA